MSFPAPPRWQLPRGVNRGLWDYLHDPQVAQTYEASLAGSPLFDLDRRFLLEHCPDRTLAGTPSRLIDLGCGTGRLLIPLARAGWWVLGVDLSPEMLSVARARAEAAGVSIALLRANLAELDGLADGSFDHAACLFSTLGMVLGASVRRRVVAHVFRLLRPGGRFILHVHNRWFHLWDRDGRRWLARDLPRHWWKRPGAGDRVMPTHQGLAGLTLHLFSRRETLALLREQGFRIRAVQLVGLGPGASLSCPGWFPGFRAYGFLIAAEKV